MSPVPRRVGGSVRFLLSTAYGFWGVGFFRLEGLGSWGSKGFRVEGLSLEGLRPGTAVYERHSSRCNVSGFVRVCYRKAY